jgi:hypothetical protein
VGACAAGLLATCGVAYTWLGNHNCPRGTLPQNSLEELQRKMDALEQLMNGPKFLSSSWFKYAVWNYFLSPACVVGIGEFLIGNMIKKLSAQVFYDQTISWYLSSTKLGELSVRQNGAGQYQRILVPGVVMQELEHHAAMLDDADKSSVPVDIVYHRQRIIYNINELFENLTGLIAFMYYNAELWSTDKRFVQEAAERARYLYNLSRGMADKIEAVFADDVSAAKKQFVMPILKDFFVELEQVMVSFARIERDHNALYRSRR